MLLSFNKASDMVKSGKLLHISGAGDLLEKLPKGNWVGGSTEYFMSANGGVITDDKLFVTELPYKDFKIETYDKNTIHYVMTDAYENGFSIIILPSDSPVHITYADKAPEFEGMFIKNIVGWVSGVNLEKEGQIPLSVNGLTGDIYTDKAVVLHIGVPENKTVSIGIVNIFEQDENSPVFEFEQEGFSAKTCTVDGKKVTLANYLEQNNIDTQLPLIGDYSGIGVNISFKAIENDVVNFYAPVFPGIKYRMAKKISNYVKQFNNQLKEFENTDSAFSCNCILNFLYGELEGKDISTFFGPITFGEVAYQLLNQTLVYITVS